MNVTTLRSFLGLINYYSTFLQTLHNIWALLNGLLRKDTKWNCTHKCEKAFTKLKDVLISDMLFSHYIPDVPIIVAADALNYGVGVDISHFFPDGSEKPLLRLLELLLHLRRTKAR